MINHFGKEIGKGERRRKRLRTGYNKEVVVRIPALVDRTL